MALSAVTSQRFEKYDPAEFVVPASDAKGHSERVWCRLQPGHHRQLDVILKSRKFPFRTVGDIIRWAVVSGIKRLEQMEEVPSVTAQVDAVMDVLRDEMFNHEFLSMFEAMSRVVQAHLSANAPGEARRLVAVTRSKIDKMPEGYWRDRYAKELEDRFGYLLQ